jgi:hypothetical protein
VQFAHRARSTAPMRPRSPRPAGVTSRGDEHDDEITGSTYTAAPLQPHTTDCLTMPSPSRRRSWASVPCRRSRPPARSGIAGPEEGADQEPDDAAGGTPRNASTASDHPDNRLQPAPEGCVDSGSQRSPGCAYRNCLRRNSAAPRATPWNRERDDLVPPGRTTPVKGGCRSVTGTCGGADTSNSGGETGQPGERLSEPMGPRLGIGSDCEEAPDHHQLDNAKAQQPGGDDSGEKRDSQLRCSRPTARPAARSGAERVALRGVKGSG